MRLLTSVADGLRLYLDHRFRDRAARGEKILWDDGDGNSVDYDFVMELDGSDDAVGVPVAFFECFWRRGSRHSKDKARDDSGKLAPMSDVHPTARFLGIVAAGDFTQPARQLVLSREIDLFYVPKDKVIAAFAGLNMQMDYPDTAPEDEKQRLVREFRKTADRQSQSEGGGEPAGIARKAGHQYVSRSGQGGIGSNSARDSVLCPTRLQPASL